MAGSDIQQSWEAYTTAWSNIDQAQREQLVESSVTGDVEFSNPQIAGRGKAELIQAMAQFQTQFPGAYFRLQSTIIHHDQLLSAWTLHAADGSPLLTGHNYARADSSGRLMHIAGFFS